MKMLCDRCKFAAVLFTIVLVTVFVALGNTIKEDEVKKLVNMAIQYHESSIPLWRHVLHSLPLVGRHFPLPALDLPGKPSASWCFLFIRPFITRNLILYQEHQLLTRLLGEQHTTNIYWRFLVFNGPLFLVIGLYRLMFSQMFLSQITHVYSQVEEDGSSSHEDDTQAESQEDDSQEDDTQADSQKDDTHDKNIQTDFQGQEDDTQDQENIQTGSQGQEDDTHDQENIQTGSHDDQEASQGEEEDHHDQEETPYTFLPNSSIPVIHVEGYTDDLSEDSLLGEGEHARVFSLSEEPDDGAPCLKVYRNKDFASACREARTLEVLNKVPGLPRVIAVLLEPAGTMMTQQGNTTFDKILRNPPVNDVFMCFEIIRQIAIIIKQIHDAGYVHNGIKPKNIGVEVRGIGPPIATVLDLDRSTVIGGPGPDFSRSGKLSRPSHIAPELFNESNASPASDVYAVCYMLKWTRDRIKVNFPNWNRIVRRGLSSNVSIRPSMVDIQNYLEDQLMQRGYSRLMRKNV